MEFVSGGHGARDGDPEDFRLLAESAGAWQSCFLRGILWGLISGFIALVFGGLRRQLRDLVFWDKDHTGLYIISYFSAR